MVWYQYGKAPAELAEITVLLLFLFSAHSSSLHTLLLCTLFSSFMTEIPNIMCANYLENVTDATPRKQKHQNPSNVVNCVSTSTRFQNLFLPDKKSTSTLVYDTYTITTYNHSGQTFIRSLLPRLGDRLSLLRRGRLVDLGGGGLPQDLLQRGQQLRKIMGAGVQG